MSKKYRFTTNGEQRGPNALPVADNTYFTDFMSFSEGVQSTLFLEFFSDEAMQNPVTPTGGTVTVGSSPMGNLFLAPENGATINAVDVSFPDATYTPLIMDDLSEKAKITTSGITGAAFMKAIVFANND